MIYTKPELTPLKEAASAIQGSIDKSLPLAMDARPPHDDTATSAAYEADE